MPANLPPQYHTAYEKYRNARTIEEKLKALKEMWACMPKHKGTDKLQADIKKKISQLKKESELAKKSKKSTFLFPHREGAGQVAIVGPPNTGKSSILACLTNANPEIADYAFSTNTFNIGMMPFEDIQIQIIDLPPVTKTHFLWWVREIIRSCDLVLLVMDPSKKQGFQEIMEIITLLKEHNIFLVKRNEKVSEKDEFEGADKKNTLLVLNKIDLLTDRDKIKEDIFSSFSGEEKFPFVFFSCLKKENYELMKQKIFEELGIIRIYTKEPGKPVSKKDPLIVPRGTNLLTSAEKIHKDFAYKLKYARLWGSSRFDGQRVEKDYILQDKDIVEFHI